MLGVGKGVDIEELADGLEYRAGVFRRFLLCDKALLLHDRDIEQRHEADDKEGQLVGDVRGVLIDYLQNAAVGKGAERVKQAIDYRDKYGDPALGVVPVASVLPCAAKLLVLVRLGKAKPDNADAHERHSDKRHGRHLVPDADGDNGQHRDYRAGAVAYRGGYRKLDISKPQISHRHRHYVQCRHGQIRQDNFQINLHAADEYLIRRVQTHHDTDRRDHLEMGVFVLLILTANF